MPAIHITTFIKAPPERVFDLSRSLALYKLAIRGRKEQVNSSSPKLIDQGETITIRAKHLGKTRMMTSRVIELSRPRGYVEEQVKGDLKVYRHEHFFKPADNGTIMIDIIEYGGPRDLLGAVAGKRYLADYLEKFIQKKADLIREYAETDRWKVLLS